MLRLVGEALRDLRHGEVVTQVHDGQVVQIDRTDRLRPSPPPTLPSRGEAPLYRRRRSRWATRVRPLASRTRWIPSIAYPCASHQADSISRL